MKKFLRWFHTVRPNKSPIEWAMTVPRAPGWVMRVGKPVQLIGGKTWTISFMRLDGNIPVEDFWEDN